MANQEHLNRLGQGVADWNTWRVDTLYDIWPDFGESDPGEFVPIYPDLSHADLSNCYLGDFNLSGANLSNANLRGTNLKNANLSAADLRDADLRNASLPNANLGGANLSGANFNNASLTGVNLNNAKLNDAKLSNTYLYNAYLYNTDLSNADLSSAKVRWTIFGNIDLRTVKGLKTLEHNGPSTIGADTIMRSGGDIPEVFLRGIGLDDAFINYVLAQAKKQTQYYSCFISYSSHDQEFADQLYTDLQSHNVRCWFAPHELKPGDYYREKIDESIRTYDKLVLILSQHSIKSKRVEEEVKSALKREESMDMTRQVLFPIRLDDAVIKSSRSWLSSFWYLRHIGDFTHWKEHKEYQKGLDKLLRDLKAQTSPL